MSMKGHKRGILGSTVILLTRGNKICIVAETSEGTSVTSNMKQSENPFQNPSYGTGDLSNPINYANAPVLEPQVYGNIGQTHLAIKDTPLDTLDEPVSTTLVTILHCLLCRTNI